MNRIMPEVWRRRKQTPLNRDNNRWTGWVSSLIKRYTWIPLRYRAPVMMLVHSRVPLYILCQRWEHHAWKFYPKINLTIGRILQTIGYYSKLNREVAVKKDFQLESGAYDIPHFLPTSVFYSPGPSLKDRDRNVDSSAREKMRVPGISDNSGQTALRQVFTLINHRSVLNFSSTSLIQGESDRIINRVVHERRRLEDRIHRTVVMQKQRVVVVRVEQTESESQNFPRTGKSTWSQSSSQPALNVEQLTEHVIRQIDHRIKAYRERRGRAF